MIIYVSKFLELNGINVRNEINFLNNIQNTDRVINVNIRDEVKRKINGMKNACECNLINIILLTCDSSSFKNSIEKDFLVIGLMKILAWY